MMYSLRYLILFLSLTEARKLRGSIGHPDSNNEKRIVMNVNMTDPNGFRKNKADGPIHNLIHRRSKSKSGKYFESMDIPKWPLISLVVLPFIIFPGLISTPTIAPPDPDCACGSRRDGSRHLQILEDFDDDFDSENIDAINPFLPQSPLGYTEQFCFCHCYCDEFQLVSVFRNDTNGEWSNNNITDKPDFINPLEPTCGCVDPLLYIGPPRDPVGPNPDGPPTAAPSKGFDLAPDRPGIIEDPTAGLISVPPQP